MSKSSRFFRVAIGLIALVPICARPAKADTYAIGAVVDNTQDENFLGIDDNGDFIVNDSNNSFQCGELLGSPCFEVFLLDQSPYFSSVAPTLDFNNETPCSSGVCSNNGHELFWAWPTQTVRGIFDGPNLSNLILLNATIDGGFMNPNGDAVFIDGEGNDLIFAYDLSTAPAPEPGSLLLFGTGCLAVLGAARRHTPSRTPQH